MEPSPASRTRRPASEPTFHIPVGRRRHRQGYSLSATASSGSNSSSRRAHLRRLFDVVQLCLARGDMRRARRAWTVLNKAVEIDGRGLWDLEALLVGAPLLEGEQPDPAAASKARKQYLQEMQGLNRSASPAILLEYVLHLLAERRFQQALAELDLYLPTVPYALDPTLHENAGMVALMLAQETSRQTGIPVDEEEDDDSDDERLPKVAQDGPRGVDDQRRLKDYLASLSESTYHGQAIAHFNRALALDPSSEVARGYLQLLNVPTAAHSQP